MRSKPFIVKNASIIFANFRGIEKIYNPEGKRNFCLVLNEELADVLSEMGVNVRETRPRDENDIPKPFVKVNIRYDYYPPDIYIYRNGERFEMDEYTIGELDWMDIEKIDLSVVVSQSSKYGTVSVYLRRMNVYPYIDELDDGYNHVVDVNEVSENA